MSDQFQKSIAGAAAVLALVTGLAGMFGAFVLLPSRMEAAEKQIQRLNERDERHHEMLVRIEERLIKQGETLQELKRK